MNYQCSNRHRFEAAQRPAQCRQHGCESRVLTAVEPSESRSVEPPAATDTVSRWFVTTFWIGIGLCVACGALSQGDFDEEALLSMMLSGMIVLLGSHALFLIGLHRSWRLVQPMRERSAFLRNAPTPGMAVGLLFVPVFNLYWVFKALGSLPQSLRSFAEAQHIELRGASPMLGLAASLSWVGVTVLAFIPLEESAELAVFRTVLSLGMLVVHYLFARQMFAAFSQLHESAPRLSRGV